MKKVLSFIIMFFLCIPTILAFSPSFKIDVDKISISAKGEAITKKLEYQIDTSDLETDSELETSVKTFTKKLVEISLADVPSSDKQSELTEYVYIDMNNGSNSLTSAVMIQSFVKEIDKYDIKYEYIKIIRVIPFENGILSFVYIPDADVSGEEKDIVLTFWLKEVDGEYKIHFPWINLDDDLEEYFNNVSQNESNGSNIGGTYKSISLSGNSVTPSEEMLSRLYNENVLSNVQISAVSNADTNVYASGFFIREGIIATTWSTFLEFLSSSDFIYVNDSNGTTYNIDGVVAASIDYDIVLLKLDKEAGKKVTFANTDTVKLDDLLFTINSKSNTGFSINYGSFISLTNGKMKNFMALSSGDIGSALYNSEGKVVGFNTGDILYSELSSANSTDYIIDLQSILVNQEFSNINSVSLETFKNQYYNDLKDEKVVNNIPDKVWNKYKNIGKIEENISLTLVKANYEDDIISLRYKNNAINSIDTMYLIANYTDELVSEGYKLTYNSSNKKIYTNNKYKIIIKENLNYVIIIMMEC